MEAVFRSQKDEIFSELPEPPAPSTRLTEKIQDPYLTGIENYIAAIGIKIKSIQASEIDLMKNFAQKLPKFKGKQKKDNEEQERLQFQTQLANLRRKRKEYREMERDALNERIKYLDSMMQQKQEQEYLRYKLFKLRAIPEGQSVYEKKNPIDISGILSILFQIGFVILMGLTVEYREDSQNNNGYTNRIDDWYSFYTHIAIMIFFGWGFLGSWLKKYGFGSLVFSFYISCIAMEWSFLGNGFFRDAEMANYPKIQLNMFTMVEATFCATSLVVSLGAVLGKLGILGGEILFYSLFGTLMWCVNYFINILVLKAADHGGAMTVHLFGAMYGLGATVFLSMYWERKDTDLRGDKHPDLSSTYTSDLMSMMGTLFLWVMFPSWNSVFAPDTSQHRVAINTFLALTSSCIVGFILSRVFRRKAFDIRDIQSVTLVGGIAMGSGHNLIVTPAVSLLIGGIAAATSMVFDVFAIPFLEKRSPANRLKVYDTRHVISFHAVPGFIGGVASIIAVVMNSRFQYGINTEDAGYYARNVPRQGGYQMACLVITFFISLVSGLIVGVIIYYSRGKITQSLPGPFTDENHFIVPSDFPRAPSSVQAEVQPTT